MDTEERPIEGGVIQTPTWPDGCRLTLNELAHPGEGHLDCRVSIEFLHPASRFVEGRA